MTHPTIRPLLDGLVFPEGPRWRDGRLWFSDMHAQEVVAVTPGGEREVVARVPGNPSGLGWLPDGRLLIVSMEDRRLLRQEADGSLVEHADLSALATGTLQRHDRRRGGPGLRGALRLRPAREGALRGGVADRRRARRQGHPWPRRRCASPTAR